MDEIQNGLAKLKKQAEKIAAETDKLVKTLDAPCLPSAFSEVLANNTKRAQAFALNYRSYFSRYYLGRQDEEPAKLYQETFQITIKKTAEGWYQIRIPAILKRKEALKSQWFLRRPLELALSLYFGKHPNEYADKYSVIAYVHYVPVGSNVKAIDNDNYEVNGITDDLGTAFLRGDQAFHCFIFSMSKPSDNPYTEIYIVPQREFAEWCGKYVSVPVSRL